MHEFPALSFLVPQLSFSASKSLLVSPRQDVSKISHPVSDTPRKFFDSFWVFAAPIQVLKPLQIQLMLEASELVMQPPPTQGIGHQTQFFPEEVASAFAVQVASSLIMFEESSTAHEKAPEKVLSGGGTTGGGFTAGAGVTGAFVGGLVSGIGCTGGLMGFKGVTGLSCGFVLLAFPAHSGSHNEPIKFLMPLLTHNPFDGPMREERSHHRHASELESVCVVHVPLSMTVG
jgi:hypothetical protein